MEAGIDEEEHGSCSAVGAPGVAGGDVIGDTPSPKGSIGVFGDMGSKQKSLQLNTVLRKMYECFKEELI